MLVRVCIKESPPTLLVGIYIGTATRKTIGRLLKKLKIELPYDPAVLLLSIYLKKTKTLI